MTNNFSFQINKNPLILPNITLGAKIRDDCNSGTVALEESLDFILRAFSQNQKVCSAREPQVVGVVGTGSSGTSLEVASLLRLFRLPQVSYAATSPDLSNRDDYKYFTRTVPSDECQAEALIDVIDCLNWTAVYLISSSSNYGQQLREAFVRVIVAKNRSVCIVGEMEIDARIEKNYSCRKIKSFFNPTAQTKRVRGVVLLIEQVHIKNIFDCINKSNISHDHFVWLGTDAWGTEQTFLRGVEAIADGAITIALHASNNNISQGFYNYFKTLRPLNNSRNPWFDHFYNTLYSTSSSSSNDTDSDSSEVLVDDKIPYVIDSVYALAHSLDHMLRNSCSMADWGKCVQQPAENNDLLDYLLQVNFSGASGMVKFDNNGNGMPRYDIMNYINGTYRRIAVWEEGQSLGLNFTEFHQRTKKGTLSESICTATCREGEVCTNFPECPRCCWDCRNCSEGQYKEGKKCEHCPERYRPNKNKTGCERLPQGSPGLFVVVVLSVWASVGIAMVAFVTFTMYRFYSSPMMMASGRELMLVLLAGIALCYSLGFSLLASLNARRCVYQRYGAGVSLSICYSAILVKTNRIARIFRGNHRPAFITPKPQLLFTALLISVQLAICFIASGYGTSLNVTTYSSGGYQYTICWTSGMEYVVSISYNVLLLLLCTCYAFLTRKLPANFNEARKVGITMYSSCVLWIAFLPLFYGSERVYNTAVLLLNSCFNATVLFVGMFAHLVYVVWFRPEKNTRRASNPRARSHSVASGSINMDFNINDEEYIKGERDQVF